MAKYILSKKAKGKKYQYTVTDEKGNVISTRTSARDYVACTANGEFYFGRLDLIGKGDHGKGLSRTTEILANAELRRCKIEAHRYFDELYKRGLMKRREAYKWLSDQLGLPPEYTHIGMFNPETCAKVVDVSKKYLLTMRFALRRQDKIKAHFEPNGDEMLNRIKESLTRFFAADRSEFPEGYREIEDCFNQLPGEPYPTIAINDVGNDDRMIEFYVTGKQYDVYHVAFKGFTKG